MVNRIYKYACIRREYNYMYTCTIIKGEEELLRETAAIQIFRLQYTEGTTDLSEDGFIMLMDHSALREIYVSFQVILMLTPWLGVWNVFAARSFRCYMLLPPEKMPKEKYVTQEGVPEIYILGIYMKVKRCSWTTYFRKFLKCVYDALMWVN